MSIPHLVDRLIDLGEVTQADIEWADAKRAEFATMRIGAVLVREKMLTHCQLKDGLQAHLSEVAICGGRKKLGESLVDLGYISEADIQKALSTQKRYRQMTVVDVLVEEGLLTRAQVQQAYADLVRDVGDFAA